MARNRYTIAMLHDELDRYKVEQVEVLGRAGSVEVTWMLDIIIRDSLRSAPEPHRTSPWLLEVPHIGIGILYPNPGGKRNRDGSRGGVRIKSDIRTHGNTRETHGTSRTRLLYKGRKPISDAPLEERIQSRRSRKPMARKERAKYPQPVGLKNASRLYYSQYIQARGKDAGQR